MKKNLLAFLRLSLSLLLFFFAYGFVTFAVFLLGFPGAILFAAVGLIHLALSRRAHLLEQFPGRRTSLLLHISLFLHIITVAVFLGMPVYYSTLMRPLITAALALFAFLLWARRARRTGLWFPIPLDLMACLALASFFILIFETGGKPSLMRDILSQKSVTPVLVSPKFQNKSARRFLFYPNDMQRFISDSDDNYLYVSLSYFGSLKSGVLQIDLNNLRKIHFLSLPGCHDFDMNARENLLYVSGAQQCSVYVIRIPQLTLEKTIPVKSFCWPNLEDIVLLENDHSLLINEEGNLIYKVDIDSGKILKKIRTPYNTMVDVLKTNPSTGRTYAAGDAVFSVFAELDPGSENYSDRRFFYWGMDFAFSPLHNHAYLNNTWTGALYDLDLNSFRIVRKIKLAPGLRDIAYDQPRGLIYVGNYANGKVYAVDEITGSVVAVWFFGKRVRDILVTKKSDRVFVLSAYGIFEIDVDRSLSHPHRH